MKLSCSGLFFGVAGLLGLVLGIAAARAEDFAQASAAAQQSIAQGFKRASLPLLRRATAGEPDAIGARLVERLCPAPCPPVATRSPGDRLELTGNAWTLQVVEDGTAARFDDLAVAKRAHLLAREPSQKMSASALERAGRAFIAGPLAPVIALGPDEELVPIRTDYRTEGIQNVQTRETIRSIVANRIVFGRILGGVPVVGGGSTVVLTFANDGSLESFQYDWPRYQIENVRSVVGRDEILERVKRVIGLRMGVPTSTTTARLAQAAGAGGIELARNTQLQSLECGYYDAGFAARQADAPVQPGCVYHVVTKNDDGDRAGFAGAVPAAARIEPDTAWPEVTLLRGQRAEAKPLAPESSR